MADLHIVHCDLDAFFASVEQRDDPSLKNRPVVVGGEPRSRGVVSTCSYEARQYGIRSAMPLMEAYRLCPEAVFLPVDMKRYAAASKAVFEVFYRFTPLVEPLSIDEAFLDVAGCEKLFGDAETIARRIKETVWEETELPISIGISINKFLAKLATELAKPAGIRVIERDAVLTVLTPLPVSYLWGVGGKTKKLLEAMGICTIGELRSYPSDLLEKKLGHHARSIWLLAHGIDDRSVETEYEMKSIGRETTFSVDVKDAEELDGVLFQFAQIVGRRLRHKQLAARTVTIKIRFPDFKSITRSRTLPGCTDADMMIYRTASSLLQQAGLSGRAVRLIGLQVSKLRPVQPDDSAVLFADEKNKDGTIDAVLDNIRDRYGEKSITRARLLHPPRNLDEGTE